MWSAGCILGEMLTRRPIELGAGADLAYLGVYENQGPPNIDPPNSIGFPYDKDPNKVPPKNENPPYPSAATSCKVHLRG